MRTQSVDTRPEFERIQIAHLRTLTPARKFASIRSWTRSIASLNRRGSLKCSQSLNRQDIFEFVLQKYGRELATALQQQSIQLPDEITPTFDIEAALLTTTDVFRALDIEYALTGSLACSIYGFHRSVRDIDIIVNIQSQHIYSLVASLSTAFSFTEQQIAQAIAHSTFFSLLHLPSFIKVDILLPSSPFEYTSLQRKQPVSLFEQDTLINMLTREDTVLSYLLWYQQTGATADDQWNDIIGLLKVQVPVLDISYLRESARQLNIADILEHGFADAGIGEEP